MKRRIKKFVFLVVELSRPALNVRPRTACGFADPGLIFLTLRWCAHTHWLTYVQLATAASGDASHSPELLGGQGRSRMLKHINGVTQTI